MMERESASSSATTPVAISSATIVVPTDLALRFSD
jgi:hypothetical protein